MSGTEALGNGKARPPNDPQTIDGETGRPIDAGGGKSRRRIDLTELKDVRLELSIVYRKMDAGEIESADGTKRAYVLKTIADVIALAELEHRIQELEERGALPGSKALPHMAQH